MHSSCQGNWITHFLQLWELYRHRNGQAPAHGVFWTDNTQLLGAMKMPETCWRLIKKPLWGACLGVRMLHVLYCRHTGKMSLPEAMCKRLGISLLIGCARHIGLPFKLVLPLTGLSEIAIVHCELGSNHQHFRALVQEKILSTYPTNSLPAFVPPPVSILEHMVPSMRQLVPQQELPT